MSSRVPRQWSLRRRLTATAAVIGVVLLAVVGTSVWELAQVRTLQERTTGNYFTAVSLSERQFRTLVDTETAVRGYALTGDAASLQPMEELQRSSTDLDRVRAALAGDTTSLAALERAAVSAGAWYATWAQPAIAQLDAGQPLTADQVRTGTLQFDGVRAAYDSYLTQLVDARSAAVAQLDARTSQLFAAVLVSTLVAAGSALALGLLLRRWVTEPIDALAGQARAVRDGDLEREVTGAGPSELWSLAADVDAMRASIVRELDATRAREVELASARARAERSSEELARSNRDLEQFAYVASHDLQEPLRKVASFCQLLQKRYGGQLDERADQYIEFAVDGAKRMQQLINDLLAFSRVGRTPAGDVQEVASTADLGACLERALASLASAVEETGAQVTSDELPVVPGQAGLLTQLLQNLLANALKFRAPDRPVRVHVGVRSAPEGEGAGWELCCHDDGIGVEPQYADRVFVIFQRLHSKEAYGGTGIGLALCKRIVEHHGGRIWVDTAVEQGTTVRWTLPGPPPAGRG